MHIDVSTLYGKDGFDMPIFVEGTIDEAWNRLKTVVFLDPVVVEGTLKNQDDLFILTAKGRCKIERPCDRCLEPVKEELTFDLEEMFSRETTDEKNSNTNLQEEVDELKEIETFLGDQIDLTDVIKKSILGTLPMKCLCSQSCNGLCSMCGENLNIAQCDCDTLEIDPRLESLRTLFSDDEEV
ncbi:MAG: DUF177 domain-containing protein [Bacillota bacterium]